MNFRESQISVASVSKAIKKAMIDGKLDLSLVNLYNIFNYYIDFTQSTIDNDSDLYIDVNQTLRDYRTKFKYINSKDICSYKITTDPTIPTAVNPVDAANNTAPTLVPYQDSMEDATTFTFTVSYFTTNFTDAEGDSWNNIIIYPNDSNGTFTYKGQPVTDNLTIKVVDVINLIYTRPDETAFVDNINFRISDNNINELYSSITSNTLVGTEIGVNQPATIGDNTIYTDNRIITVLTLEMFTSQLAPPYNDPEGDLIDAIRIDTISNANQGIFYYNSNPVVEGLVISREDINAGLFTHEGPDVDTISSDVFTFSARDEGSQIWVQ